MKFGEKLRDARLRAELTQETVAKTIGVSRQSLSNWENDRTYPDLGSVLKLSDLYNLSLDDLLRDDMELRRSMEEQKQRVKKYCSWLHDFAMLLLGSTIWLAYVGKTTLGLILGIVGISMICVVHYLFAFRMGADGKNMALRCLAMVLWFGGLLIRILTDHTNVMGTIMWIAGLLLHWYGSYSLKWEEQYPRHMTAFTGFVLAMVLVFGTMPMTFNSIERGDHIEGNPFTGTDYRVAAVLTGEEKNLPMVYLGRTYSMYLDYPGQEAMQLKGEFTYITQPEGAATKGIWEMIPEDNRNLLYRVMVEADDSITIACREEEQTLWAYRLEPSPKMGCTILDVLGSVVGSADWYYAGSFDEGELLGGLPLRGKGTIKLSVPGEEPTVTIYEEFRDGDHVEHQTMVLTKERRGFVEFKRETRQDGGNQIGIYRIPYEDGEFVLVLKFAK